jgi:hypothetical protein
MPRFDQDKKIFMVEKYNELQSSLRVIEAWKEEFPHIKPPIPGTILINVKKFHNHGSVDELPRTRRKKNAAKETAKNELIDLIDENPTIQSGKQLRRSVCLMGVPKAL